MSKYSIARNISNVFDQICQQKEKLKEFLTKNSTNTAKSQQLDCLFIKDTQKGSRETRSENSFRHRKGHVNGDLKIFFYCHNINNFFPRRR